MTGSKKTFVIFGGTGDLTYRKLIPAFYDLYVLNEIKKENFEVVVIGRRDYTNEIYHETIVEPIFRHARFKNREHNQIEGFKQLVTYYKMDFNNPDDYEGFKNYVLNSSNEVLFYLAVSPSSFTTITDSLVSSGLTKELKSKQLLIEKPFGDDLASAIEIDTQIKQCFKEEEIYRIDHYLAKEMMLNILTIRFANQTFEKLWDSESIENIQISALEEVGVNERGNYYDDAGALKDMFQSHLLQILSYVLMKRPKSMNPIHLHKAQQQALQDLKLSSSKKFSTQFIKGQYDGYLQEKHIDPNSTTETFVSMVLSSKDKRFKDVPIYVRTGKKMHSQSTYVAITFKPVVGIDGLTHEQNILIIRIGPDEGIYFKVNIKRPGMQKQTQAVSMDFCQSCIYENRLNTPQAYERLIMLALNYDRTLFASWPIVLKSWEITEKLQVKAEKTQNQIHVYEPGSNGPQASYEMLEAQNHQWVDDEVLGQYFSD